MYLAVLKLLFQKQFVHTGKMGELRGVQGEKKKKEIETFNTKFHGNYYFLIMSVSEQWEARTPPGLVSSLVYITQ